jgi:hypothetical protein
VWCPYCNLELQAARERAFWATPQAVRGPLGLNGKALDASDGAAIQSERALDFEATADCAEVLLFDFP